MSERGVFAVDRGVWDHPVFADEPFTEREAFLWLVGEASYKSRRVRAGAIVLDLGRGQVGHSLRFMASKWQWKEPRVRRFLVRLKNDAMIDASADAGQTIITICNYDRYQRVSLPSDAPSDALPDAETTQHRRKEEYKEYKEDISSLRSDMSVPIVTPAPKPRKHPWPDDYEDRIWKLYPKGTDKKVSLDRLRALYRSDNLPYEVLVSGIERLVSHISDPKYAPTLDRFIRQEKWNDEYETRGPPRRAGDLFSNSGDNNASPHHNRTGQTSFRQPSPTGVDAVFAAMASRKARRAQSMGGGDLERGQEHTDDSGIVDAQWADATGT